MIPLHSPMADVLSQTSPNQSVTVSGHLFYLAHVNLGNYSTGQKPEFRQRYKARRIIRRRRSRRLIT
jgi:hypothetical protein